MNNNNQPTTYYKWEPEDTFTFSGKDFSMLYNILEQVTATPDFQQRLYTARETMSVVSLHELMKAKLQEGVASGIVKPVTKEEHDQALADAIAEQSKKIG